MIMLRHAYSGAFAAALMLAAPITLPHAWQAGELLLPSASPEAIAEYRLNAVSAETYQRRIEAALIDDDQDLAASLVALAQTRTIALPTPVITGAILPNSAV